MTVAFKFLKSHLLYWSQTRSSSIPSGKKCGKSSDCFDAVPFSVVRDTDKMIPRYQVFLSLYSQQSFWHTSSFFLWNEMLGRKLWCKEGYDSKSTAPTACGMPIAGHTMPYSWFWEIPGKACWGQDEGKVKLMSFIQKVSTGVPGSGELPHVFANIIAAVDWGEETWTLCLRKRAKAQF